MNWTRPPPPSHRGIRRRTEARVESGTPIDGQDTDIVRYLARFGEEPPVPTRTHNDAPRISCSPVGGITTYGVSSPS